MKNKDAPDCIKAFENMISSSNMPHSLFSDNDASFLSNSFSSMLDRKRIAFNVNTINEDVGFYSRSWVITPLTG